MDARTPSALLDERLQQLVAAAGRLLAAPSALDAAAHEMLAVGRGHTLFVCGNGGSAAQAIHVEAELVGRYRTDRAPLRSLYLGASASTSTAVTNDFGQDEAFARPLRALARPGDVLLALSTSGSSSNVVAALDAAREIGVRTVLLTGPSADAGVADVVVRCSGERADLIQDSHQLLIHVLMDVVEDALPAA